MLTDQLGEEIPIDADQDLGKINQFFRILTCFNSFFSEKKKNILKMELN